MDPNVEYIIENYYDRMIHYERYIKIINKIESLYEVDYIYDIENMKLKRILLCIECRHPILQIDRLTKCKCKCVNM